MISLRAQTVYQIIQNSPDHTILEAAIDAAGLDVTLNGTGPFTVFAPNDDAFNALGQATITALLADPMGDLTNILLYHVLGANVASSNLNLGLQAETVQGGKITVVEAESHFYINQAKVMTADLSASNGVVHVIDAVITPPNSMMDVIANSPVHTVLEDLLVLTGLDETVAAIDEITIFAPVDASFEDLDEALVDGMIANPEGLLTRVLLNHAVDATVLSSDVQTLSTFTGLSAYDNPIIVDQGDIAVGWLDAEVIAPDVTGPNGVIHVTDDLVFPFDVSVNETIQKDDDLSTLGSVINLSELNIPLSDPTSGELYTIFAPNNAAFDAVDDALIDALLADPTGDLADVLGFHVIDDAIFSYDITGNGSVETLNGQELDITVEDGDIFVNGAMVIDPNYTALNGIVHIIENVLLPLPNTVVDIVVDSPDHESLEDAVIAAELATTLSGEGPFTVFAPNDAAFEALGQETLDALFADPTGDLAQILKFHVVEGKVFSTDLSDGQEVTTLTGEILTVTINTDGVFINDEKVVAPDLEAVNGVVHGIDGVLVPLSVGTENTLPAGFEFNVFPNPSSDAVQINIDQLDNPNGAMLELYNAMGQLMKFEDNVQGTVNWNVQDLANGQYFLKLITTKGNALNRMQIMRR